MGVSYLFGGCTENRSSLPQCKSAGADGWDAKYAMHANANAMQMLVQKLVQLRMLMQYRMMMMLD